MVNLSEKIGQKFREILGLFLPLSCCNFRLKQCERSHRVNKKVKAINFKEVWDELELKNVSTDITNRVSKTNSCFHVK